MNREAFVQRVQALREAWSERRQVRALASAHDFESQFLLLEMLYGWAADAVADVNEVYGGDVVVELSPLPLHDGRGSGFTLTIAAGYSASLSLIERPRAGSPHWFISVGLNAGPGGASMSAGPQRRTGQWTRGQLEDVILSVLGAYERSISTGAGITA